MTNREHKIKAAFLYNFIKFIDWPIEEEKDTDEKRPIVIGVIGSKDFVGSFGAIKDKRIRSRAVVVKYFEGFDKPKESSQDTDADWNKRIAALRQCSLLMFCSRDAVYAGRKEAERASDIVKALAGSSVLTVGERPGFLETGGNINFFVQENKVRFEINLISAKRNKLSINATLLRLAKRVVKEKRQRQAMD